jgi:hypothetical protein
MRLAWTLARLSRLLQYFGGPLVQAFPRGLRGHQCATVNFWRYAEQQFSRCRFLRANALLPAVRQIVFDRKFKLGPQSFNLDPAVGRLNPHELSNLSKVSLTSRVTRLVKTLHARSAAASGPGRCCSPWVGIESTHGSRLAPDLPQQPLVRPQLPNLGLTVSQ